MSDDTIHMHFRSDNPHNVTVRIVSCPSMMWCFSIVWLVLACYLGPGSSYMSYHNINAAPTDSRYGKLNASEIAKLHNSSFTSLYDSTTTSEEIEDFPDIDEISLEPLPDGRVKGLLASWRKDKDVSSCFWSMMPIGGGSYYYTDYGGGGGGGRPPSNGGGGGGGGGDGGDDYEGDEYDEEERRRRRRRKRLRRRMRMMRARARQRKMRRMRKQ